MFLDPSGRGDPNNDDDHTTNTYSPMDTMMTSMESDRDDSDEDPDCSNSTAPLNIDDTTSLVQLQRQAR
jgi:hypothetical protein